MSTHVDTVNAHTCIVCTGVCSVGVGKNSGTVSLVCLSVPEFVCLDRCALGIGVKQAVVYVYECSWASQGRLSGKDSACRCRRLGPILVQKSHVSQPPRLSSGAHAPQRENPPRKACAPQESRPLAAARHSRKQLNMLKLPSRLLAVFIFIQIL